MRDLARARRFEEAADARDRHTALAAALDRRRIWSALQLAGSLWAEDADGDGIMVEAGRLSASWNSTQAPPLFRAAPPEGPAGVAPSVEAAEEAHLIWRWLGRPGVEIVDCSGILALPVLPVRRLAVAS
jgi:hypothetical protein